MQGHAQPIAIITTVMILEIFTQKTCFVFMAILWLIRSSPPDAHTEMMQYPLLVLNDVSGLTLTEEMENCLIALADETMGPEGNAKNTGGQYL